MKKITVFFALINYTVFGQPIDGVYEGEFVSQHTVFVISTAGTSVVGQFYTNKYQNHIFLGTATENEIQGILYFPMGLQISLRLKNYSDTLSISVSGATDSTSMERWILMRVSKNPKYNIEKLFTREPPQLDDRLIGRWLNIKNIDRNGREINMFKSWSEYSRSGKFEIDQRSIKEQLNKIIGNFGDRKQVEQIIDYKPRFTWHTQGSKVVLSSDLGFQHVEDYEIFRDTLIMTNRVGSRHIYVRVKQ